MKKNSALAAALLGIVLGVMLAVTVYSIKGRQQRIKVSRDGWQKLELILEQIDQNYVEDVDYESVTEAAATATLSALDPHSMYMPPVTLKESETELAGGFDGIGIQFNVPNDTAIVLEVIPGGPSEKIGLQPGDRLLKVDDEVIAGVKFPQDSMVRRMKGQAGTKVLITVKRDGEEIPFEITRGKIPVNSVDAAFMINDSVGYIKLEKFTRSTTQEFVNASKSLLDKGMTSLIFDLRDNTGGYFDQALNLCNLFLEKDSKIVYMEGLHRPREDFSADGRGFLKDIKLTVLIDEGTASSSEIFSGAMQDNDRGTIVGRRSFGKGLVQEPINFSDGSGIRLTVARFYTPSGRCIQKPYSDDYQYDIYKRYETGELTDADSIKVNKDEEFFTVGGRSVYGGGGIVPDVFVPLDTTKASMFYSACSRKATPMRFASYFFDNHKQELGAIDNYDILLKYLDGCRLDKAFLDFASSRDALVPAEGEWEASEYYMMPQIRALVGRYSKLGDEAFYHLYLDIDDMVEVATAL